MNWVNMSNSRQFEMVVELLWSCCGALLVKEGREVKGRELCTVDELLDHVSRVEC